MDKILVKYLLAEVSEAERHHVERWLEEKAEHRKYYRQLKAVWEESRLLEPRLEVDEVAAWNRFKQRLQTHAFEGTGTAIAGTYPDGKPEGSARIFSLHSWKWSKIAAGLALLLIAAAGFIFVLKPFEATRLVADNQVTTDLLPDQSKITLNKHASLSYRKSFNKGNRSVFLNGEAFFEIHPDKALPFEVNVDAVTITVVGTAFNVKESEDAIEIIVEHGIVRVESAGSTVTLHAGERAEIHRQTGRISLHKSSDQLYQYYRTREFVCNETPLFELVDALNNTYGRRIVIPDPKTAALTITTRFYQEDLDDILKIIAGTLNLKVRQQGDKIILY